VISLPFTPVSFPRSLLAFQSGPPNTQSAVVDSAHVPEYNTQSEQVLRQHITHRKESTRKTVLKGPILRGPETMDPVERRVLGKCQQANQSVCSITPFPSTRHQAIPTDLLHFCHNRAFHSLSLIVKGQTPKSSSKKLIRGHMQVSKSTSR